EGGGEGGWGWERLVREGMSGVRFSLGSARNSFHDHIAGWSTAPVIVNVQLSRSAVGVGPADNTGKSSTTYWPGGIRLGSTSRRRRPPNPREISGLIAQTFPTTCELFTVTR